MTNKMKKYVNLLWVLLLMIVLIGCKKEPFNYRNKFLGDWKFNVERFELNTDSIGYYYHDSLTYFGQIKYGNSKDQIHIEYSNDNSVNLTIDKENILSNFPSQYCSGAFEGHEKLHLYLKWGGLGGGINHIVDGEKQ
jgi:hypothetical protein